MASTDTEVRILIQSDALRRNCEDMLVALGVSAEDATTTVDVFIQAELMGEESHGTRLFLQILGRLKAGGDRAQTKIDVVMDHGAVATWDANRSLGQVVAARAMGRAIEKAKEFGIGFVGVLTRRPSTILCWRCRRDCWELPTPTPAAS